MIIIDWDKIKEEYINTAISYKNLSKKYNVSFWELSERGRKEGWFDKKIITCPECSEGKGNNGNMIPITMRSKEEQKRMRAKGHETRRKNFEKKLNSKECAKLLLDLDIKDEKARKVLSKMGIENKDLQNRMLLLFSLYQNSVKTGDPNRIKTLFEIAGELENQEQQNAVININVSPATESDVNDIR